MAFCCSFASVSVAFDPTETRYMRSDLIDTYYKLLTENTITSATLSATRSGELWIYIAVRVRDQAGNVIVDWMEITVDSTIWTLYTITANIPNTYVEKVIVDVRVRVNGTSATRSFITETLNAYISGTWNFKLWARYYYSLTFDRTYVYFSHGSATYNSRIENFSWSQGEFPLIIVIGGIFILAILIICIFKGK